MRFFFLNLLLLTGLTSRASLTVLGNASDLHWTASGGIYIASFTSGQTTLFSDSFNRSGALAGSSPDVGNAWVSTYQDGSPDWSTSAGVCSISGTSSSVDRTSVSVTSGYVYTLTLSFTLADGSGNWVAIGFDNGSQTLTYDANGPWLLVKGDGTVQAFYGGTGNSISITGSGNASPTANSVQIVLDTTGGSWTTQIWVNGTQRGSATLPGGFTADRIMIADIAIGVSTTSSYTLTRQ